MPDAYGNTPLHKQAADSNEALMLDMIRHGGDVNMKNASGHTPLDIALRVKNLRIAEVLILHGAVQGD